jgi:hypothetical protein
VIKSRRVRWVGHVARLKDRKGEYTYRILVGKPEERDHSEGPGVAGSIILKLIFKTWYGSMDWIDLAQNRDR